MSKSSKRYPLEVYPAFISANIQERVPIIMELTIIVNGKPGCDPVVLCVFFPIWDLRA